MKLTTTIVDDMNLGVGPTNFRADPVKRTAVGRGLLGLVHFLWPVGERMKNLTLYYENLSREQARHILTALGRPTGNNRVLQLDPDGPAFFIPGKVSINVSLTGGYASVTIETIARRFGSEA